VLFLAVFPGLVSLAQGAGLSIAGSRGITASLEASGRYEIRSEPLGWVFAGTLESAPLELKRQEGRDGSGAYQELSFRWRSGALLRGSIRTYEAREVVLLAVTAEEPSASSMLAFPRFSELPPHLRGFSYGSAEFSPPGFTLQENGSPWLLFDGQAHAAVISPASHFMIASLRGDGHSALVSTLNAGVAELPAGFTQQTLLAIEPGINAAWEAWGAALVAVLGAHRPANDADMGLRYLGYWTDHGAAYYYNYEPRLGYAGTLAALVERYRREHIPVRYLQLDSWWYPKTLTGLDGRTGQSMNPRLPAEDWNRGGGMVRYEADRALFPEGLAAFQQAIGLPLITHSRWIAPSSPYHADYRILGLAPVDPRWWQDVMGYLAAAHVASYEQDWLNILYERSPDLARSLTAGDAFSDEMAGAAEQAGLTLQYSMALPRQMLQGARYANLTTARVSQDRMNPPHWDAFLYSSRLASALGIWPWSDVFMSGEREHVLLATLSAGMVGIGDRLGKEDRDSLLRSVRPDGVIVKPDRSLVPLDSMYGQDAQREERPMLASAATEHGPRLRTAYVFAYRRSWRHLLASFRPQDVGISSDAYVYNTQTRSVRRVGPSAPFCFMLFPRRSAYFIVTAASATGITLLGDPGKLVPDGKKRLASLVEDSGGLSASVVFAPGEESVQLLGFAARRPQVTAHTGSVSRVAYDPRSGRFELAVHPGPEPLQEGPGKDPVRQALIALR
jgi:hypothetical protein